MRFHDVKGRKERGAAFCSIMRACVDFIEEEDLGEDFAKYLDEHSEEYGTKVDRPGVVQLAEGHVDNWQCEEDRPRYRR